MSHPAPTAPVTLPARSGSVLRNFIANPGFLMCVALLTALTVIFQVRVIQANIRFSKLPLPLKKPLPDLDQKKLGRYKMMRALEINAQTLDALGTKEYIQWILEDTGAPKGRPERYLSLFVTYYTGKPDQVPHVPEVCEGATGAELDEMYVISFEIPALGPDVTIPIKVLEFKDSNVLRSEGTRMTFYTFHANGEFKAGRRGVQLKVSDPASSHAYFSKLEIRVGGMAGYPDRETSIEAAKAFFQVIIPILIDDHWPDWNAAEHSPDDKKTSEAHEQDRPGTTTHPQAPAPPIPRIT